MIIVATSSFQKNFAIKKSQEDQVVSVMTSNSLGVLMSKKFESKFDKVINHKEKLSRIFSEKE